MKNVFLETYGCQMNEYDTELIRSILAKADYAFVTDERKADVVMLNTCSIRENADRKVYGRIHAIKHQFREEGQPRPLIGILGCMATNFRKALLENPSLDIDFIAGPDSYKHLPTLIAECYADGAKPYDVTLSEFETYSDIFPHQQADDNPSTPLNRTGSGSLRVNAWIAVMRGCNNFCTFCVVPYTRGRERSRSVDNVVDEVRRLAGDGFKQVTLLGQNVNSYRHENDDFAALLEAVSTVDGIERIRFTSPHPKDFPDRLLEVIAGNPKVCKHIHMPLQAGNNRVLDLMNRTYTQEEFLGLIEKTRRMIPNVALTTDIIVGFPTETDEEFEDTFKVMKEVEFDSAFIFKYSERPNTIASRKYPDDVPDEKKSERTVRLNDLQKDISLKKNRAHIGKTLEVLIEDEGTGRSADACPGRTDGNKLVILPQNGHRKGNFVKVRITDASPHALKGNPA